MDDPEIRRARALARILDTAVGIPGTKNRIGLRSGVWDSSCPVRATLAARCCPAYIVLVAATKGAPRPVIWRMLGNIAIDTALGSVPLFAISLTSRSSPTSATSNCSSATPRARDSRETQPAGSRVGDRRCCVLVQRSAQSGFLLVRLLWRSLTALTSAASISSSPSPLHEDAPSISMNFVARFVFARAFGLAVLFFAFRTFFAADFVCAFGFGLDVAAACERALVQGEARSCGSARIAMIPPGMSIGLGQEYRPHALPVLPVFFTSLT